MSVMKVSEIPYRRFTIEEAQEVFSTFEQEMKSATSAVDVLEARQRFRTAMEEASTAQSLANAKAILAEAGLTLDHVVKTTVFLADMSYFAEMNAIYAEQFAAPYPARSAFAVKSLPKDALVEIEMIAMR